MLSGGAARSLNGVMPTITGLGAAGRGGGAQSLHHGCCVAHNMIPTWLIGVKLNGTYHSVCVVLLEEDLAFRSSLESPCGSLGPCKILPIREEE